MTFSGPEDPEKQTEEEMPHSNPARHFTVHETLTFVRHSASMTLGIQIIWLFILAIPIACIAWTVTHEEVFREVREFCVRHSKTGTTLLERKFFYLFTCEYCFSHYVVLVALLATRYALLLPDWRGYIIAGFALVWIANVYMNLFGLVRIDIKSEKLEADLVEQKLENEES
jgi:hypothetical protein